MKLNTSHYMHFFTLLLLLAPCFAYGANTPTNTKGNPHVDGHGNVLADGGTTQTAGRVTPQVDANGNIVADSAEPAETKQPQNPKLIPEYHDPIHFMADFLDADHKKKDKPLKYWALQLVLLLKNDPKLIDFCRKIQKIALNKPPYDKQQDQDPKVRAKNINGAFLEAYMHQLFSHEFSNFIIQQGLPKVKAAIEKRAAVVSAPQEKA